VACIGGAGVHLGWNRYRGDGVRGVFSTDLPCWVSILSFWRFAWWPEKSVAGTMTRRTERYVVLEGASLGCGQTHITFQFVGRVHDTYLC